jgi:prokaryotic ubiquitin-like protein Pup
MSERETAHKSTRPETTQDDEVEVSTATGTTAATEQLDADVDAILDEIDDVLETNAAEFVQGFVQKGGQ